MKKENEKKRKTRILKNHTYLCVWRSDSASSISRSARCSRSVRGNRFCEEKEEEKILKRPQQTLRVFFLFTRNSPVLTSRAVCFGVFFSFIFYQNFSFRNRTYNYIYLYIPRYIIYIILLCFPPKHPGSFVRERVSKNINGRIVNFH